LPWSGITSEEHPPFGLSLSKAFLSIPPREGFDKLSPNGYGDLPMIREGE
jgi:hypothetical protein